MTLIFQTVEAQIGLLLDARAAWSPQTFDLMALAGHAGRAPSGAVSLDPVVESSELDISSALAQMSPTRRVSFEEVLSELDKEWRIPLIQAYAKAGNLASDRVLVPVKALTVDRTGHFIQMTFRRAD